MSDTPTRLKPVTLPAPDTTDHDRIMVALRQAVEDQELDNKLGQCARGVAVIWFREYPDGGFGESWIIEGMNSLEAVGLMHMTAVDITQSGLDGGPDHFPGGRPAPDESA